MKTLILMRHGDAGQASSDFDRVLSDRGVAECEAAAAELLKAHLRPQRVICSSAPRALQSAQLVAERCASMNSVEPNEDLYLASPERYLQAVRETAEHVHCLLLVAHNPGLSTLAGKLKQTEVGLRTGDYAVISWSGDSWQQLGD